MKQAIEEPGGCSSHEQLIFRITNIPRRNGCDVRLPAFRSDIRTAIQGVCNGELGEGFLGIHSGKKTIAIVGGTEPDELRTLLHGRMIEGIGVLKFTAVAKNPVPYEAGKDPLAGYVFDTATTPHA